MESTNLVSPILVPFRMCDRCGAIDIELHAAGDDDFRVAVGDLLQAESDRAQARTAKLVHAPRRLLLRNAGRHGGLPRRILTLAAGKDLAQDDFIDIFGRDIGSFERAFDGNRPEFMGGRSIRTLR